jgi:hypothetical protein
MESNNPYYVPPVIPDLSPQIMQFGEMGIRNDQLAAQRAMEQQKINNEADYHNKSIGIEQQNANTNAQMASVHQAALPATKQPWNIDQFNALKNKFILNGLPVDQLNNVLTPLQQMAQDPNMNKGDIANAIEHNWSNPVDPADASKGTMGFKDNMIAGLQTQAETLARKAAGMDDNDPKKAGVIADLNKLQNVQKQFASITPEQVKQAFFPDVYQEEANTKAALFAAGDATRAAKLKPETQFIDNETKLYMSNGMSQEQANVKAFKDLSNIEAAKMRAGRTQISMGGPPMPANIQPAAPGQRNEAALQGVSAGDAAVIKQLADYKIPLPSGMALRTPYWQNILGRVAVYEPTFDATQYNVRMGVKRDFTSGKTANIVNSLNTVVGHLDTLSQVADKLDNGSVQKWNQFRNALSTNLQDDPRVTNFNTAAAAVAGELATVFKNTGGTDQEIKAWHDKMSSSQTPAQLHGSINEVINLLGSRLDALRNKYEQGLGKPMDFKLLSPKSRTILKGLGANVDEMDPGGSISNQIVQTGTPQMGNQGNRPPLSSFQK